MPKLALVFGVILILQGIITYVISGMESATALIPSGFGALLVISGILAKNPAKRKHAMHAAALVGLLGVIMPLGRLIPSLAKGASINLALGSMIVMAVISLIFVILCVRSFIAARRSGSLG